MHSIFFEKVKHELCFITWIYKYFTKKLSTIEVDDNTLLNNFIHSIWWLSIEDASIYFDDYRNRKLKPHYQKVFFRELARAIEYLKIEEKSKEVKNETK